MITITIGGTDYTSRAPLPIKWNKLLDERLDEAVISVHSTDKALFPIGAEVNISVTDDAGTKQLDLDFIVSGDTAKEVPNGSGQYDHDLTLIEPTKILEGIVSESLTFTNALGRYYTGDPVKAQPVYE